jgi:DNA helicase-2/ATP-dependent DNA helicase PcrA
VIKESGLEKMYEAQARSSGSEADENRLETLSELVSSARQFEMEFDPSSDPVFTGVPGDEKAPVDVRVPALLAMLRAYLESIALVADADAVDASQGAVTMMTLHAAKGLEFAAVAVIGLEEGLLPHSRARESDAQLEEERRLCFVGITRAMKHLHITAAKFRTIRGVPERSILSRFIDELPREHVILSDQSDAGLPASWGGGDDDDDLDQRPAHERGPRPAPSIIPGLRGGPMPGATPRADGGKPKVQFPVGSKVRHPQFGLGTVTAVTPGTNARATIHFLGAGTKTLVLEFARLTPAN